MSNDEGPAKWNRWMDEMDKADREAAENWRKNRPAPTTDAERKWRQAELVAEKLAETGDTPKSFMVKGAIGCTAIAAVAGLVLWLSWRGVRALLGF